jgi:hypothetical protein
MMQTAIDLVALHKVRKGSVDFVDIPELGYLTVAGIGRPGGARFTAAVQALYTVSYGARFLLKKERGDAPPTMPLEAQWWVDDPAHHDILAAVALGTATMADTDRTQWQWRAMIVQPEPIDIGLIAQAVERARTKALPALRTLRYERWEESRCAQVLHIGPYSAESPSIMRLHKAIAGAGYRPRGRHHEIYLSDPRRCAPHRLRTILRHPIAPAG